MRGTQSFAWADNDTLLFTAQEEAGRRETALKDDKKDNTVVVEDEKHEPPVRLFRVAVKDKTITRLTDNTDRIDQLAVAPDGNRAVTIHNRSLRYVYDNKIKPIVLLHDLKTGQRRQVFKDPALNISTIQWALDGKGFYATNEHSSQPQLNMAGVTELYFQDADKDSPEKIDLGWDKGLSGQWDNSGAMGLVLTKDGFVAILADGVRGKTARFVRDDRAWQREWITGEHAGRIHGLQVSSDGKTLVYAHSTASKPTQWYRASLSGAQARGSGRPHGPEREPRGAAPGQEPKSSTWKGALKEQVEGILFYPHGYQPGKKYALVVQIHGGPAAADLDDWDESWAYAANFSASVGPLCFGPTITAAATTA